MSFQTILFCLYYNVIYQHIYFAEYVLGKYFIESNLYQFKNSLENEITNECFDPYIEYYLYDYLKNVSNYIIL